MYSLLPYSFLVLLATNVCLCLFLSIELHVHVQCNLKKIQVTSCLEQTVLQYVATWILQIFFKDCYLFEERPIAREIIVDDFCLSPSKLFRECFNCTCCSYINDPVHYYWFIYIYVPTLPVIAINLHWHVMDLQLKCLKVKLSSLFCSIMGTVAYFPKYFKTSLKVLEHV